MTRRTDRAVLDFARRLNSTYTIGSTAVVRPDLARATVTVTTAHSRTIDHALRLAANYAPISHITQQPHGVAFHFRATELDRARQLAELDAEPTAAEYHAAGLAPEITPDPDCQHCGSEYHISADCPSDLRS